MSIDLDNNSYKLLKGYNKVEYIISREFTPLKDNFFNLVITTSILLYLSQKFNRHADITKTSYNLFVHDLTFPKLVPNSIHNNVKQDAKIQIPKYNNTMFCYY